VKSLYIIGVLGTWFQRANDDRTTAAGELVKYWVVCGLPVTPSLVQHQKGRKKEWRVQRMDALPTHLPAVDRFTCISDAAPDGEMGG
jgi:hypothetical protein